MTANDWRELLPHRGAMCLLEAILAWDDATLRARAVSHRDPRNPLRSDDRLRALHACEYAAQAMAVHGGLLARRAGRRAPPGVLAALRDVRLHVARLDDLPGALEVEVRQLLAEASGWLYAFRVVHAETLLAEGRATILMVS